MKIAMKPSLLILCSLVLILLSVFVPATKIQYQVIVNAIPSATTSPTFITEDGYEHLGASDKYGTEALSCTNPRLESLPSAGFINLLVVWRWIVFMLTLMPFLFALQYALNRKMPLLEFFAWTASIAGVPVLVLWVAQVVHPEPIQPLCNFEDLYRVVSFTPNWLFIPLPVAASVLGYFGFRHDSNSEIAVVAGP
jgi:hypothetical protein